jgi:glycogen debranching enzyme
MKELLTEVALKGRKYRLYNAGLPSFPRNFTRDAVISHILTQDMESLKEQVEFCAALQGTKSDPYTGQEEGKIFHEYPNVDLNGKGTMFNACDTTALFLIGCRYVYQAFGDDTWLANMQEPIKKAVRYILAHIDSNGFFFEDPAACGSDGFALKVTYWKDSILLNRSGGQADYPVIYTLAQAQNLSGLKSAALLLDSTTWDIQIKALQNGLNSLFNSSINNFVIARDQIGDIIADSDDFLHMLFYLDPEDINQKYIEESVIKSHILETPFGYRTNSADFCSLVDTYHSCTLWPFEQAVIHFGARKFGLKRVMEVSSRIKDHLVTNPEYFMLDGDPNTYKAAGNDPQLWTWANKEYFRNNI